MPRWKTIKFFGPFIALIALAGFVCLLFGCAAKDSQVAGFGDGQTNEVTALAAAVADIKAALDVNQDAAGVGDGQRAAQQGLANFAVENEMGLTFAAVFTVAGLSNFWLQRMRIINDRMRLANNRTCKAIDPGG